MYRPFTKLVLYLFLFLGLIQSVQAQNKTAHIDQPISSPTYVNLYWDSSWDADSSPYLTKGTIDAITQAIIQSSYFKGLSEYGVNSVSFGGGFLPEPSCPSKAPNSVGFYDPIAVSIAGFIQCEHDIGPPVLRQNNVIYNVILPPSARESDFFSTNFCNGPGTPVAWHYHGLEDTPPWPFGGGPFSGQPIYTIVQTNPACDYGSFISLTHEMVEAATDPYPIDISIIPPHINIASQNEIGDLCEGINVTTFADSTGYSELTAYLESEARVTAYWSNAQQKCISFADTTAPLINSVAVSNWGSQSTFNLSGSGFGVMPNQIALPSSDLPYIEVRGTDSSWPWKAQNTIYEPDGLLFPPRLDNVRVIIPNWSDTQVNNVGFRVSPGTTINTVPGEYLNNVPGGLLLVWLCNPNSLKCSSKTTFSAPGPYNPRLNVVNAVAGEFDSTDTIAIFLGGQQIMSHDVQGLCRTCTFSSLQTLPPGTYAFTQSVTGSVPMERVSNGCQNILLASGEETSCSILDQGPVPPPPICGPGTHYCGTDIHGRPICISDKEMCP